MLLARRHLISSVRQNRVLASIAGQSSCLDLPPGHVSDKPAPPPPPGIPSRAAMLSSLSDPTVTYDVLIVGGGATGAGCALDAAARGLKVACLERGDFASETSSRSTKLIWAGSRYRSASAQLPFCRLPFPKLRPHRTPSIILLSLSDSTCDSASRSI